MKKPIRQIIREKREWEPPEDQAPAPFRGWFAGHNLPHCDKPGLIQFITFHLHDALSQSRVHEWATLRAIGDKREHVVRLEQYWDRGFGSCCLQRPEVARLVEESFLHFDAQRYRLIAWVIMPNHVHLVMEEWTMPLPKLLQSLKSLTARRANQLVGDSGAFWQDEYFDRFARDEEHFNKIVRYVEGNPVRAGLCRSPEEWPFSSANSKWQWTTRDLHQRYSGAHLVGENWERLQASAASGLGRWALTLRNAAPVRQVACAELELRAPHQWLSPTRPIPDN